MMNRAASLLRLACLALCATCFTPSAHAATLNVPAQYATIQAAVDAANAGDTVLVADGTYSGAGNYDIDFGGKDLIVQSASGNPDNCIIDCQQLGCAFTLHSGETKNSNIAGFTITNGVGYNGDGGGVYISSDSPTIDNCVFTGNVAIGDLGSGGGLSGGAATNCVFIYNRATIGGGMSGGTATNCVFTGNSAFNLAYVPGYTGLGGGMSGGTAINCVFTYNAAIGRSSKGSGMYEGTAINCVFTNNRSNGFYTVGGGMYGGAAINCVFTRNAATGGGGMCAGTATNCVFTGNSANNAGSGSGGGMCDGAATNCLFTNNKANSGGGMSGGTATNCAFTGNKASFPDGSGGGMYLGAATNCAFTGNSATNGGGTFNTNLYFCAIYNNTAQISGGGGIYTYNGFTLTNCIVWGNTAGGSVSNVDFASNGVTVLATYCDIQGGYAGKGNINADPLFVNAATGNLHLKAGSPCINVGTATVPTSPYTTFFFPTADLDGGNRIVDSAPDMGAYETGNPGVSGSIAFEGIAANAPAQIVTFQFRPVSGGATINQTYFKTSDGAFYLYGVPDGSYNLWIKSPTYLAMVVPMTVIGGVASVTATLEPGDCNNDNFCDATDFGIFVSAYNSDNSIPGTGYDPRADLNGDGFVDPTDFGLFVGSYNTQGAP